MHAKIHKSILKNINSMPISILLQKLENREKSKISDFIKENTGAKLALYFGDTLDLSFAFDLSFTSNLSLSFGSVGFQFGLSFGLPTNAWCEV